ncbi:MAG: hypothetical protein COB16_07960 [Rhodobacteraceae bacterium]|nr:MAG: hypothetical protein COB16_07960 [Paracoccaceae bacterium]
MLLSGCVSRIQISEIEAPGGTDPYFSATTSVALTEAGLKVANEYLKLSDQVATTQDAVSVFNILLAAGAAFGVVNGMSSDSIARVGIAGLAINQTGSYFDPVVARNALTKAAKRNLCVVNAAKTYAPEGSSPETLLILREAFVDVRFQLRADLDRDPKYYAELFEQYKEIVEKNSASTVEKNTPSNDLLREKVAGCKV